MFWRSSLSVLVGSHCTRDSCGRISGTMRNSRWPSAVAVLGGCGSLGLTLWVGRNAPRVLLVMFIAWVASPFAALFAAARSSSPWATNSRATVHLLVPLITTASLTVYTLAATRWNRSTPAFLMVPLTSWLLIAAAAGSAAWTARKR